MTEDDKIALFKYGIIAPIINDSSMNQKQYFERASVREYDMPGKIHRVTFNSRTFKKWLHIYRKEGYEGLKPSRRTDRGKSRKISMPLGKPARASRVFACSISGLLSSAK